VTINISLTVWTDISHSHCKPLHHTDNVRVKISRKVSAFVSHRQFELTYLTESVSVHILLTAYQPYITDILSLLISLILCTLIFHLVWWLAYWLRYSVNAVRYPNWIASLHHSLHSDSEANAAKSVLNIGRWLCPKMLQICTADLNRPMFTSMFRSIILHKFCV
jgi:hypothetical protein